MNTLVRDGLIDRLLEMDASIWTQAKRIDYARSLERIESLKAEKRMKTGKHNPCQISDKGKRTDEFVSEKLGIGSRDTYRKEKYIVENQESLTPKDFSEWDEGNFILSFLHK